MRVFNFCILVTFFHLTRPSLAFPFTSPNIQSLPLERRTQICSNVPNNHKAGTPLAPRTLNSQAEADTSASSTSPSLSRRTLEPLTDTNPTSKTPPRVKVICAPGTSTYTQITYEYPINYNEEDTDPLEVLYDAETGVHQHIAASGDGLISGAMNFEQDGLTLYVENANNHQLSWGVLGAAMQTLGEYMHDLLLLRGLGLAAISFLIYDGMHQVGAGYLKHT